MQVEKEYRCPKKEIRKSKFREMLKDFRVFKFN